MLINCRIKTIYFAEGYPDDMSRQMLDEAQIPYHLLEKADRES
jgi:dCMP deaminase